MSSNLRQYRTSVAVRRIAMVANPKARDGRGAAVVRAAVERLGAARGGCEVVETRGDRHDVGRVAALCTAARPDVVIAAGGDGTVRDVVQGIMQLDAARAPALAILPLGTANNIARGLGIPAVHREGDSLAAVLASALAGARRCIDLGMVGEQYFVGSFAVGMDADILSTRNRLLARLRWGRSIGGYPLYLWSCAINLLHIHGSAGELAWDGTRRRAAIYNLLVTNTPIYAGEFRFDADNRADDGRLDVHLFTGALDYLRRYPAAWIRHLRHEGGHPVSPPRQLARARTLELELATPLLSQIDGELYAPATSFQLRAAPGALTVVAPPTSSTRIGAAG
jgi:diacylglycerol kinase family enzyme